MNRECGPQDKVISLMIPGTVVNWEELTVFRREEDIVPGTDHLDANETIGELPPEYPVECDELHE